MGRRAPPQQLLWGDCQGSGKVPYSTMIDLRNPAFKCTCPSRKFPCKHGLGLLLLFIRTPHALTAADQPAPAVAEWADRRNNRQMARETREEKVPDEKAQQKRADQRWQKVAAGAEELAVWLKDAVRAGVMNVPQDSYHFTEKIAARMIDAQAGGLAVDLKSMSALSFYKDGWQTRLLRRLCNLYLLLQAWKKIGELDEIWQQEIKIRMGWSPKIEEVAKEVPVRDEWRVLAVTNELVDNTLRVDKVWFWGRKTRRFALLLQYYTAQQATSRQSFLTGSVLDADMAFYPSVWPLRAILREQYGPAPSFRPEGLRSLEELLQEVSRALSLNPLLLQIPALLEDVRIQKK